MHILFTSAWFPNRNSPQNGDFVQRHAMAVATRHKVTVLHVESFQDCAKQEMTISQKDNYEECVIYFPKSKFRWINGWRKFWIYNKMVGQLQPYDLIHTNILSTHTIWVLYRRLRHGERFIISENWTRYTVEFSRNQKTLWMRFAACIAGYASFLVPVSKSLQAGLVGLGIGSRFRIVPNVIDTSVFNLTGREIPKKQHFLHVSSFKEQHKNISGMLRVIRRLVAEQYDFQFTFAGNDDHQEIRTSIDDWGLQQVVHLIGNVPNTEVATLMKAASTFVLFSNYENQPCVIGEAFSCGMPIIATKVGGIPEFFPDNFGFLIDKGEEVQLYEAMKRTIEGHQFETPEKISAYAQATFSVPVIAQAFDSIYQEVLSA